MTFDPRTIDAKIPKAPGVYLMKDQSGEIIYVGKAANLRARVQQYFGATSDTRYFVGILEEVFTIDVLITSNEKEALILENELSRPISPALTWS